MTYVDLVLEIRSLGLPCDLDSFDRPPPVPYTVITYSHNVDLIADNINYLDVANYRLELYTEEKHPPTEKMIENKLRELRLPFRKTGVKIEEENLYQIAYEFQLVGGY